MGYYSKHLISALYVAVYGRAPDLGGLRYWADAMEHGQSYQAIANGFVAHPLYNHFYGQQNPRELIESFYTNILGGPGDEAGVLYWEQQLKNGQSVSDVLANFLQSAMDIDLTQQGDLTYADWQAAIDRQNVLRNKAEVGVFYAEHREAGSDVLNNADNIHVQNDPRYIEARKILEGITGDYASVEQKKNFIVHTYEREPYLIDDDWQTWFTAFLDRLMNGDWDGDTSEFDQWESSFDGLDDNDFGWIFGQLDDGNWDGDWEWLGAYMDFILGLLANLENAWGNAFNNWGDWGLDNWYTEIIDMLGDMGQWTGEDLGYVGLISQESNDIHDDFAF